MNRFEKCLFALVAFALVLSIAPAAISQELVAVEEVEATVLKKVGRTVFIRNQEGEIKRYNEVPEDVALYIDGEPATLDDLEEGMILHAVRFEEIEAPQVVTMSEVEEAAGAVAADAGEVAADVADAATEAGDEAADEAADAVTDAASDAADDADEGGMPMSLIVGIVVVLAIIVIVVFMRRS